MGRSRSRVKEIHLAQTHYPTAYHWYGEMLMVSGRFGEGEEQYKKALEIDPTSLIINTDLDMDCFWRVVTTSLSLNWRKQSNLNSNFPLVYYCLADSLANNGEAAESVKNFKIWLGLIQVNQSDIMKMETAFQKGGYNEYLKQRLQWSENGAESSGFTKTDVARFYAEIVENKTA